MSYATVAAVLLLLWAVSQPLIGAVVLAAIVSLFIGVRRAYGLVRCFYDCQGFAFDLGGTARITVTQIPADDSN